jgi:hypothetical protein
MGLQMPRLGGRPLRNARDGHALLAAQNNAQLGSASLAPDDVQIRYRAMGLVERPALGESTQSRKQRQTGDQVFQRVRRRKENARPSG